MLRQTLLAGLFLLSTYLFFQIPAYKVWYEGRILGYYTFIGNTLKSPDAFDTKNRIISRYGARINFYSDLKRILLQNKPGELLSDQIVLIPSEQYNKENGFDFKFEEPAVVYLLGEGLRVVRPHGDKAKLANWVFVVENGTPRLENIDSEEERNQYIELFKKYAYTL